MNKNKHKILTITKHVVCKCNFLKNRDSSKTVRYQYQFLIDIKSQ